jgi:hypothetical protein
MENTGPAFDPPGEPPPEGSIFEPIAHLEELGALIDEVVKVDRQLAAHAAARALAVDAARICSERGDRGGSTLSADMTRRSLIAELACALRLPERTAADLLESSRALVHALPATLDALHRGVISYRHATILVNQTAGLSDDDSRQLEDAMLPAAETMTAAQFERKTRRARERLDPDSIKQRHERCVADRFVEFAPSRDGMAWLSQYLPAADARAIYTRITDQAISLQGPEEFRTLTQLRADVFRDLVLDPDGQGADGDRQGAGARTASSEPFRGINPELIVTVPMLTLLGASEEPGSLDGYGPIDPGTARELAARCPSCIRILTHPETGAVLSVGRSRYTVPKDLRRVLQIRDGSCRFPGCSRAAGSSDVDHTVAWQHGGATDHNNLAHLCPAHHAFKHEAGWAVAQDADGSGRLTWRSPTGHQYVTEPENLIGAAVTAHPPRPSGGSAAQPAELHDSDPPPF